MLPLMLPLFCAIAAPLPYPNGVPPPLLVGWECDRLEYGGRMSSGVPELLLSFAALQYNSVVVVTAADALKRQFVTTLCFWVVGITLLVIVVVSLLFVLNAVCASFFSGALCHSTNPMRVYRNAMVPNGMQYQMMNDSVIMLRVLISLSRS